MLLNNWSGKVRKTRVWTLKLILTVWALTVNVFLFLHSIDFNFTFLNLTSGTKCQLTTCFQNSSLNLIFFIDYFKLLIRNHFGLTKNIFLVAQWLNDRQTKMSINVEYNNNPFSSTRYPFKNICNIGIVLVQPAILTIIVQWGYPVLFLCSPSFGLNIFATA